MEAKIMVKGDGIKKEIIGESLFDCIDTAYRNYKGQRVELILVKRIGYIDGDDLFVDDNYLDRHSVKEIMG
jgi:hypothetical protein